MISVLYAEAKINTTSHSCKAAEETGSTGTGRLPMYFPQHVANPAIMDGFNFFCLCMADTTQFLFGGQNVLSLQIS